MGKKKKRGHRGTKDDSNSGLQSAGKYSVNDLLAKAEELMDSFQFELALKFCERAITCDAQNVKALEMAGNIYAETGDVENARSCFLKVVEVSPNQGFEKYFELGQLSEGQESIEYYKKGVQIIKSTERSLTTNNGTQEGVGNPKEVMAKLKRYESNGYCSIAEVYLTDSCFEESAEEECQKYCQAAIDADPLNPDAYFAFANFLMSKGDPERAKQMAFKSLDIWMPKSDDHSNPEGIQEAPGGATAVDTDNFNEESKPSFESRLNLSKVLIEVKEYEKAVFVLTDLMNENDEDIQILYLLGLAHHLTNDIHASESFLERAKELYEKLNIDDEELLLDINDLVDSNKGLCPSQEEAEDESEDEKDIDYMETE